MSATHALAPASAAMVSTATIVTTTASETSSDEEEVVTILQVLRARKEIPRIKMASGKRKQSAPQQLGRSKNLQSTAKPKSIVIMSAMRVPLPVPGPSRVPTPPGLQRTHHLLPD